MHNFQRIYRWKLFPELVTVKFSVWDNPENFQLTDNRKIYDYRWTAGNLN